MNNSFLPILLTYKSMDARFLFTHLTFCRQVQAGQGKLAGEILCELRVKRVNTARKDHQHEA
jgi:hypothetical protein